LVLEKICGKEYKCAETVNKEGGQTDLTVLEGYGCVMRRFPLRGGNWNNGTAAGLGALNLNNLRANLNTNIGLRPALPLSQKPVLQGGPVSAEGKRSHIPSLQKCRENMYRHGWLVG
jgi:hypothetical protein